MKASPMERAEQTQEQAKALERILAANVAEVASELRLVNVIDLIAYVRGERDAILEDLVNCAAELYFKPGAVRYGWSAELDVLWEVPPSISLNMEFSWSGATAFFRLRLDSDCAGVALQHISFDGGCCGECAAARLSRAIADARRRPPRSHSVADCEIFPG